MSTVRRPGGRARQGRSTTRAPRPQFQSWRLRLSGSQCQSGELYLLAHWSPLAAGQRRSRWARLRTSPPSTSVSPALGPGLGMDRSRGAWSGTVSAGVLSGKPLPRSRGTPWARHRGQHQRVRSRRHQSRAHVARSLQPAPPPQRLVRINRAEAVTMGPRLRRSDLIRLSGPVLGGLRAVGDDEVSEGRGSALRRSGGRRSGFSRAAMTRALEGRSRSSARRPVMGSKGLGVGTVGVRGARWGRVSSLDTGEGPVPGGFPG